jgi:putative transposase
MEKLKEVHIIPRAVGYVLEIVYDKIINAPKKDKRIVAGIDLGVRNLATIVDNTGSKPVVVKGGAVKSIIQFYQKERARLQNIYDLQKQDKQGMKMKRLADKYEKKMHDYLHKVSNAIIEHLNSRGIGLLVIGYNDDWQRNSNIGKRNNQMFSMIPYSKLTNILQYKAEENGIKVVLQEESHTSVCSFFDNELIEHHGKYVGKRKGGLFRTAKGHVVNADVNGAFDIVKKAVPNAFQKWIADGIEGAVGHPLRLKVMQ